MTIAESVICGTFTRARRYPLIVARVWGRRISLNASVGVGLGLLLVWAARGLWQHGFLAAHTFKVYLLAGLGGGFFLQRGRLDGRAPLWTVYSVVGWLATDLPGAVTRRVNDRAVTVTVPSPPAPTAVPVRRRAVQRWTTIPEAP